MKAGLITFHHAHHYGAQLQAYALMKAVTDAGADCEIINYVRIDTTEGNRLFKKGLSLRSLLSNASTLLHFGKLRKRYGRFERFVHEDMKLSPKFYRTNEELVSDAPAYDAIVCGSDQIWNPLIYQEQTFDPAFFAAFARAGKRIAYAPSFGIGEMPQKYHADLKKHLMNFNALSVREKQGESIIREVSGRDSVTVLDPTLLLTGEDWSSLAEAPAFKDPYILCYFITDARKYAGFIQAVSEKYKMPVVSLCGTRRVVPQTERMILDAGPREFLGLFRNASLVCTDSFHGTVFSINFRKEFYCFESSKTSGKSVHSRLHNILGMLGLEARLYSSGMTAQEFRDRMEAPESAVDFAKAENLLTAEREKSLQYLKQALRG